MNPRNEHESLLDWVIRWLEYRETRRVVQAQLQDVHAELIAGDGWETDAEMARRMR